MEDPIYLVALMEDDGPNGVRKVERIVNRYLVSLNSGKFGIGKDVAEAYDIATGPNARDVNEVAA